jgi:hypothetical protein
MKLDWILLTEVFNVSLEVDQEMLMRVILLSVFIAITIGLPLIVHLECKKGYKYLSSKELILEPLKRIMIYPEAKLFGL